MTVLFTDVTGSTELRTRYGDEQADAILRRHEAIVRHCLVEHGGREVQFLGDGFLATFPSPEPAVVCAVQVQHAIAAHNVAEPEREIHVRMGLHHGPVIERDGTVYGQTVHAAARILAEAAGDQILVSQAVRDALAEHLPQLPVIDRGQFWLKGFSDRWRLFAVRWRPETLPSAAPAALTPFVEREAERAQLRRAVDAARAGNGGLVVVTGDAGVGKSRLVSEVVAEAEAHGMLPLVGHCVQLEGRTPYLPFVEILEEALLAPSSPLALRAALGDAAPEVARLVPSLRSVLPDLPPPLQLPAEQAPRYLWNSILAWLDRAARDRPLLLVLEDLHWADGSTLQLLDHLATQVPRLPVLLVGTYRDVEVGLDHPLARIVNQLARRRLVTRVALTRLTPRGVAQMLHGLAGREPPAALVDAIDAEAEGNPFFVEEVYLHLRERGRLLDERGEFRADLQIDELDVPDSVRLLMMERVARLPFAAREVLLAAAVGGRTFRPEVVAGVTGLPADDMLVALDEAERARLVMPTRPGRLMFSHELIRQTLLGELSSVRREDLHARFATTLEVLHADDLESHAEEIAFHLLRAGSQVDPQRLAGHLLVAGDRAMQAAASDEAVTHFEQALAVLGAGEALRRAQLLERLALARRGVGDWEAALATLEEALQAYEQLDRPDDVGRLCWTMVYQLTWATRYEQAMQVSARGLATLGERANPDRARLLAATAWVASLAGDHATATAMFDQARTLAADMDARVTADVLHMETIHHLSFAELAQGVEVGLRAAAVFESEGALWDLCSVLSFVMYQSGTLAGRSGTDALAVRVADLAARLGHLGAAFLEVADGTRRAIMRADLADVRALAARQIELCEQGGLPWLYIGYLYLGLAAAWRGAPSEAERQLRRAAELEPPSAFAGQTLAHLAVLLAYSGRADEVAALHEAATAALPSADVTPTLGARNALLLYTEALYVAGFRAEAAQGYELSAQGLERFGDWVAFDSHLASSRTAIAAIAAGRYDDAERLLQSGAEVADATGHRLEQVNVQRIRAWLLLDRDGPGDRSRAQVLLAEAAEGYRRLGLPEPPMPASLRQSRLA